MIQCRWGEREERGGGGGGMPADLRSLGDVFTV